VQAARPMAQRNVQVLAEVTNQVPEALKTYTQAEFKKLLLENHRFPPNVVIKGDLDLSDYKGQAPLPRKLHVQGNLYLFHNSLLLPEELTVYGNMNLFGNTCLTELPAHLQVGGDLNLSGCSELKMLPPNLRVREKLNLYGCTGLTELPQDIEVYGDADLSGCDNLLELPKGFQINGNLNLSQCLKLRSLPQILKINGNLDLSNCPELVSLSDHLVVRGNLILRGCSNLRFLPQRMHLRGDMNLFGCRAVTSLPAWITALGPKSEGAIRVIDLTGTGLSETTTTRLRQTEAPGIRFHFSQFASASTNEFYDLDAALEFWIETAQDETVSKPILNIEVHLQEVLRFLERLTTTAEYQNKQARPLLARRVIDVFTLMANDSVIRDRAVDQIFRSLASCDDRIILGLQDIELMVLIDWIEGLPHSAAELRNLGKRFMLLDLVNRKAAEFILTLGYVDEISVYLAFQITLADRFNLPIKTRNMIFRRCADITDEQIADFGDQIALACTEEMLTAYLKGWSPWIKHERRTSVPAYDSLPLVPNPDGIDDSCLISGDVPTQPVLYAGNLYDYASFVKWYVDHGSDPVTRKPIDFQKLARL
jgi:hypothetical protein